LTIVQVIFPMEENGMEKVRVYEKGKKKEYLIF
jgi:hypothetical protein